MANAFCQTNTTWNGSSWSGTNPWATTAGGGTPMTPASTDTLISNNKTVTIQSSLTVVEVTNDNRGSATAGGGFVISGGIGTTITLTANVTAGSTTTVTVTISRGAPDTTAIVGNIVSAGGGTSCVSNGGSGTVNITGSVTGGTGASAMGVLHNASGTMTVTGVVTGGTANSAHGVYNNQNGTVNIVGNVFGGTSTGTASGVNIYSYGTVNITGNVTGGGSSTTAYGAVITQGGVLNVTGDVYGSNTATTGAVGVYISSAGQLNVYGNVYAGNNAHGVNSAGPGGRTFATTLVGNGWGNGSTGKTQVYAWFGNTAGFCEFNNLVFGSLGATPVYGCALILPADTSYIQFTKADLSTQNLSRIDISSFGQAAVTDVRYGTVYACGNRAGTCRIPAAASVSAGTLVDNTAGTAILDTAPVSAILSAQLAASQTS